MTRAVAIVGFAPETRALVDAEPASTEVWGMNVNHTFMNRMDRWFQLHPFYAEGRRAHGPNYGRDEEHYEWLKTCGIPVYLKFPNPAIPTSLAYPYEQVQEATQAAYLTSSAAHMLGMAIAEGFDTITLYGINVRAQVEYFIQRPCLEYLIGIARGKGITVTMPPGSALLTGGIYPEAAVDSVAQTRLNTKKKRYLKRWTHLHGLLGQYKQNRNSGVKADSIYVYFEEGTPDSVLIKAIQEEHRGLTKALGEITEARYWLEQEGGVDVYAGELPDVKLPVELMAEAQNEV